MVRISKTTEYALVVMKHMSSAGNALCSVREMSGRYELPQGLLAKILQRLAAAGIVTSVQGPHGGYRLARDPDTVSLLELSEAVEGPARVIACEQPDGSCDRRSRCTVAEPVRAIAHQLTGLLSGTSVGSLLRTRHMGEER